MLKELVIWVSNYLGVGIEGGIAGVAVLITGVAQMSVKYYGSYLAYTRLGSNQVTSFFGIFLYKCSWFFFAMGFPFFYYAFAAYIRG